MAPPEGFEGLADQGLAATLEAIRRHEGDAKTCNVHSGMVAIMQNVANTLVKLERKWDSTFTKHLENTGPEGHVTRREFQDLVQKVDDVIEGGKAQAEAMYALAERQDKADRERELREAKGTRNVSIIAAVGVILTGVFQLLSPLVKAWSESHWGH